jgi:AraC-like DNA-binding protein
MNHAYGHHDELVDFDSGWHCHDAHQLLYASSGTLRADVGRRQWLLPPRRGAWIPAGVDHRVETQGASLRTVYFPVSARGVPETCRVFGMPPVAREMVKYAIRWSEDEPREALADTYFETLLGLAVDDWMGRTFEFSLPSGESTETRRAIEYALDHLETVDLEAAAQAAFVSRRTLTRRFSEEFDVTWREFLRQARLIRAMELLSAGQSVTEAALSVGYQSLSAFSAAFKQLVGESPRQFASEAT